jgi:hypothetical protein
MIRRALAAITNHLPARIIDGDNGEPYLERYFVARIFGCEVYLHRFVASDPDRGFHNHPFAWCASLVLSGGYEERIFRADGEYKRHHKRPGSFGWFGPDHLHRVVMPAHGECECWTLFAVGPRVCGWGFLRHLAFANGVCAWVFDPYTQSPSPDWWRTAPKGKELRRCPR